jgi:prepilin-type N-terminal cleavage/methylation domain-containing protein
MNKRLPAFTLIELLVVVAIIALLIAILLPSLARARDLAKTSVCLANLHGIGIGTASYVADNDGFLFPSTINPFDGVSPAIQLHQVLIDYVNRGSINSTNNDNGTTGAGNEKTGDKVYFCPSAIAPKKSGISTQYPLTYAANMGVHIRYCPDGNGVWPALKRITGIPRPNEIVTIADCSQNTAILNSGDGYLDYTGTPVGAPPMHAQPGGDGGFDDPTQANKTIASHINYDPLVEGSPYHVRARHNSFTIENALFLDGHGESLKIKQFLYRNLSTAY